MKILVFSPMELPFTIGARYTGLERLAVQFAEQWSLLGHEVTLIAHKNTDVLGNVKLLPCEGYETIDRNKGEHAEVRALMEYQSEFYKHDAIWDIGHLHMAARIMPSLPIANVFSANPEYEFRAMRIKAPYNLISWSKWGVGQIVRFYTNGMPRPGGRQQSRYQETIMVDPEEYKPDPLIKRSDRWLTIGRMSEEKGNLNAIMIAKELDIKLDVAGGRGSEKVMGERLSDYEQAVMDLCDGKDIVFYGEVSDEEKVRLMQSCRGLLYITNHVEITSHKVQEAMLCGMPVVAPNFGGMPEIVTHGVDGYLCRKKDEFVAAIRGIDKLCPAKTRDAVAHKYHPKTVSQGYVELFKEVAKGLRW